MPKPATAATDLSPHAIVVALVVVNLIGKAGDAFAAMLVESHPLTLLALNANDAHMALTAGHTPFASYVIVSLLRRLLEDPLYFHLGATRAAGAARALDATNPGLRRKLERDLVILDGRNPRLHRRDALGIDVQRHHLMTLGQQNRVRQSDISQSGHGNLHHVHPLSTLRDPS